MYDYRYLVSRGSRSIAVWIPDDATFSEYDKEYKKLRSDVESVINTIVTK